jgi:hypothetical protein
MEAHRRRLEAPGALDDRPGKIAEGGPRMHASLKKFLDDVWNARADILFEPQPNGEDRQTVGGRIYDLFYAPKAGVATADALHEQRMSNLRQQPGWRYSKRGSFHVWDNTGAQGGAHGRIYLDVNTERIEDALKVVFAAAAPDKDGPEAGGIPRQVVDAGNSARWRRGRGLGTFICAVKAIDETELGSARADRVVLYLNSTADAEAIENFRRLFERNRFSPLNAVPMFGTGNPPMTQRLASGIGFGREVSGKQWQVGTSFGEVRCNIVALALIQIEGRKDLLKAAQLQGHTLPEALSRDDEVFRWIPDGPGTYAEVYRIGKPSTQAPPLAYPGKKEFKPLKDDAVNRVAGRSDDQGRFIQLTEEILRRCKIDPEAPWL